jgi:hypothetical protein
MPETVATLVARANAGFASLAKVGESIEDEWQYVGDLTTVWQGRLQAIAATRGETDASPAAGLALDNALAEIGHISDPHRAIDWLSTFPQLVLLALDEEDRVTPPPSLAG